MHGSTSMRERGTQRMQAALAVGLRRDVEEPVVEHHIGEVLAGYEQHGGEHSDQNTGCGKQVERLGQDARLHHQSLRILTAAS
jgi:hypothetical protein